jgi:hypothetical protein
MPYFICTPHFLCLFTPLILYLSIMFSLFNNTVRYSTQTIRIVRLNCFPIFMWIFFRRRKLQEIEYQRKLYERKTKEGLSLLSFIKFLLLVSDVSLKTPFITSNISLAFTLYSWEYKDIPIGFHLIQALLCFQMDDSRIVFFIIVFQEGLPLHLYIRTLFLQRISLNCHVKVSEHCLIVQSRLRCLYEFTRRISFKTKYAIRISKQ